MNPAANQELKVEIDRLRLVIQCSPLPEDDYKHHIHLKKAQLIPSADSSEALSLLIDYYMGLSAGGRNNVAREALRTHWTYVLLRLSGCQLQGKWLVVSLTKGDYAKKEGWLRHYRLSLGAVRTVVGCLEQRGDIERLQGKKYAQEPSRTRLFPTGQLAPQLWQFYLDMEEPIEPPYITMNKPDDIYQNIIPKLAKDHPEIVELEEINDFLRDHQWARKGPIVMKYKHTPFQSGRLYTPFQELPDRRARVRINTLIDGQPICEVDFSANHLRMNLALLSDEFAGTSPYEDIVDLVVGADRAMVKNFITKAMGASNRVEAASSCRLEGMTAATFDSIEAATRNRFPKLQLFIGWGLSAQNLEGAILRNVMLQGARLGIVVLPVHDAVAVQQQHAEWAMTAMQAAWKKEIGTDVDTLVKVDYP